MIVLAKCIVCGKTGVCLCEACKQENDIENLCNKLIEYNVGSGENLLWDQIASELNSQDNLKNIVFFISKYLPSPKKEFFEILSISSGKAYIPKASRPWFYEIYENMNFENGLSRCEINRIKGLLLGALYMDYRYKEADNLAEQLLLEKSLPSQVLYNLADFYSKTRRYEKSFDIIESAKNTYSDDPLVLDELNKLFEQNAKYCNAKLNSKKEYMPNPKGDKEFIRKKYVDFLVSVGIKAEVPEESYKSKIPVPIPKDLYPLPREIREANFDTFVAFDFETTGVNPIIDSIIEVGAVKVVNGQIKDTAEFTFQEFVKPFKRSLKQEITNITGITKNDVGTARQMWEVIPDFIKFVGDNILVGFNNVGFDSKFLVRAGRYSNLIIENSHFDVMRYAYQFKEALDIHSNNCSLEELSGKLNIENPKAHRALADAKTTALIYLKLKEMDNNGVDISMDDFLSDLDEW